MSLFRTVVSRRATAGAAAGLAALSVVGLTACSSADSRPRTAPEKLPAASEFRAGACRSAAEAILDLARVAARNGGAATLSKSDRDAITTHQRELLNLATTADADVREPLTALTTAIGFLRIRLDTRSYEPTLLRDMDGARRNVQRACVG